MSYIGIKYNGHLLTFAGKILKMFKWVYQEGVHYLRVMAGLGAVRDRDFTEEYFKMAEDNGMDNISLAVFPDSGYNERVSGSTRFVSRLFNLWNNDRLGDELIINQADREFSSDTGYWTKSNVTISGGAANFNTATTSYIRRAGLIQANKIYQISLTVNGNGGRLDLLVGGTTMFGGQSIPNGQITLNVQSSVTGDFNVQSFGAFIGTIDNISIKEVQSNLYSTKELISDLRNREFTEDTGYWNKAVGVTIGGGLAVFSGATTGTGILAAPGIVAGKVYKITYTANIVSGAVNIYIYGSTQYGVSRSTSGTYEQYMFMNTGAGNFAIIAMSTFTGSIDNVSIQEVLINPDLTQYTAANQPYLSGYIKPNGRLSIKNTYGGSRFMTHPTISFAANEPWSLTTMFNWSGNKNTDFVNLLEDSQINWIKLYGKTDGGDNIGFRLDSGTIANFNYPLRKTHGKKMLLTFIATGDNNISLYVNGSFIETKTGGTSFSFVGMNQAAHGWSGEYNTHIIRPTALTPTQVTAEYNFLRSYFPEIDTIEIGNVEVADENAGVVTTPMGNTITEYGYSKANVPELVTNGDFSSGGSGWTSIGGAVTYDSVNKKALISANGGTVQLYRNCSTIVGKYYVVSFTVLDYVSGSIRIAMFDADYSPFVNSNGSYYFILRENSSNTNAGIITNTTFVGSVTNISIKEATFADSKDVYNYVYGVTVGTEQQKVYAALKAAAMWRSVNNSLDAQAIYEKEYNWYAIKLFKDDIASYNAANPTEPWGYHVATKEDMQAIKSELGVTAGQKMKHSTNEFWSNDTGTNDSGFTGLPSGYIDEFGVQQGMGTLGVFWTDEEVDADYAGCYTLHADSDELIIND